MAAILAADPIRKIAVLAAFVLAAVIPSLLPLKGDPASALVVALLFGVAAEGAGACHPNRVPSTHSGAYPPLPPASASPSRWHGHGRPGLVAEAAQDVVGPAGELASNRQSGRLASIRLATPA